MAEFTKLSRAQLEEVARSEYRKAYARAPVEAKRKPARNTRPTLLMVDGERISIPFQGRVYELRPVSFEDGLRLLDFQDAIEAFPNDPTPAAFARYRGALRAIVRMAPRLVLPRGRVRRALWRLRLRRNPFRKATEMEVGELLGFFSGSRMMSSVRYPRR